MVELTSRLRQRLDSDFGAAAPDLAAELERLPESINSGQDPERIQASVVLGARGSVREFAAMVELARVDWRDLLVCGGLENADYVAVMRRQLG
ncbi:hypothetical protein N802_11475 [Knoellia sinensis KCTC 19936]|uniref:Uncharacterized protein n=1 Tax=Knoellia sinensis KCTC 19936 TaxID=1385520 RepID=A0A0A0IZM8_9MICO|nr:hypothetical protein N802_11475 [Knoellia sinensis KCTC 19936]